MNLRIFPPEEILETTVRRLPASKSIVARSLVLDFLSGHPSSELPEGAHSCEDIEVISAALKLRKGEVSVRHSGTALRFLTACYAATEGCDVTLTGSNRLCERPIAPLVDALRRLGADIEYAAAEGFAPLRIRGRRLKGGRVALDASASSQFASALALVGPTMETDLCIDLGGQIPSMPYLKMTLEMLQARGIEAFTEAYTVVVKKGEFMPCSPADEPDWTAASYWYSIAGVTAGWVELPGMRPHSLQGDSILAKIGERFGVITEFNEEGASLSATPDIYSRLDMDMRDYPDLVPALAVTAALIGIPFSFSGVANLRIKESDRIENLRDNLMRLGVVAHAGADSFGWEGERVPITEMPMIHPRGDHRIAMAFSVASCYIPGIIILDSEVVDKSYPGFFFDLRDAGFTVVDADSPLPTPEHE